jgi:hypothetical protein
MATGIMRTAAAMAFSMRSGRSGRSGRRGRGCQRSEERGGGRFSLFFGFSLSLSPFSLNHNHEVYVFFLDYFSFVPSPNGVYSFCPVSFLLLKAAFGLSSIPANHQHPVAIIILASFPKKIFLIFFPS